jgi:menaquinone-dependent protoporphyrinogen oxidase
MKGAFGKISILLRSNDMAKKILVAYASMTGSTAGVAEEIGKTLSESGAQVEVYQVHEVTNVDQYDAVVLGSAIHGGIWLPEAMSFLQAHRTQLARKPFAAFLVCMTMSVPNKKFQQGVADWLQPVRSVIKPISEGYFAGALDISKIPSFMDRLKFRISVLLRVWSEGDHRDWTAIRNWATNLAPKLQA